MIEKKIIRNIVALSLAFLASRVIHRHKPKIIMVTGSVGKTSTKDAIAAALSNTFFLRKSEKSFNSEFGVPLTIFGSENPWKHPLSWLRVFAQALALIFLPSHYPRLLVLEVSADSPGDLTHILRIATPDIVVVTRLPNVPVHVEAYATPQDVRDEEFAPAYALAPAAPLIISIDDPYALEAAKRLPARVVTYGSKKTANAHFKKPHLLIEDDKVVGIAADVLAGDFSGTIHVRGAVGLQQLAPVVAALSTAIVLGVSPSDALAGLNSYVPPPGRTRILSGIHNSLLIDDSYNSSPVATQVALEALHTLPCTSRRIVVLGDMLELGRYSLEEHTRVGKLASKVADIIVTVGIRARGISQAACSAGFPKENVQTFETTRDTIPALVSMVHDGDVVLIKGSQSVRMERIVEALLENPADVSKLVRQDTEWKKRA